MKRAIFLLAGWLLGCGIAPAQETPASDVNLIFIGRAVTAGQCPDTPAAQSPAAVAARLLEAEEGIAAVRSTVIDTSACGDTEDPSGTDATIRRALRAAAEAEAAEASETAGTSETSGAAGTAGRGAAGREAILFSIQPDTDDRSGAGQEEQLRNLRRMIDTLRMHYPQAAVVLHAPLRASAETPQPGKASRSELRRLQTWSKALETLVESYQRTGELHVATGNLHAAELFEDDPEKYYAAEPCADSRYRLRPGSEGAELLGRLWERELLKAVRRLAPLPDTIRHTAQYERYAAANRRIDTPPEAVFMGNSITDFWIANRPEFFARNGFVDRGISGQTTCEMLARFRPDVIELKPKAVVILAGINDIARNSGYIELQNAFGNIISMCELAKLHGIKVVLCSVTPCTHFWWCPEIRPAENIRLFNTLLRRYAEEHLIPYVDYYTALADDEGGIRKCYSDDECHPNAAGYAVMEPLVAEGIRRALRTNKTYFTR